MLFTVFAAHWSSTVCRYEIGFFAKNGFHVVVENHAPFDLSILDSVDAWVANWVALVTYLSADPEVAKRLIVDVLNEPDALSMGYEVIIVSPEN